MSPLNDKLRYVTSAGQIDNAAITADIPRRAQELARRHGLSRCWREEISSAEWLDAAKRDLKAQAGGELALYEVRARRAAYCASLIAAE